MSEPLLTDFVGAMTVRQLAEHAGVGIEELVGWVLEGSPPRVKTRARRTSTPARATSQSIEASLVSDALTQLAAASSGSSGAPSQKAPSRAKASRPKATRPKATRPKATRPKASRPKASRPKATRPKASQPKTPSRTKAQSTKTPSWRELRGAVDRWLVGEALDKENGNITYTAQRLGTTRKGVRERWARVHKIKPTLLEKYFEQVGRKAPSLRTLRRAKTLQAVHDLVDAWLLGLVMAEESNNISAASRRLQVSRRNLRERWARVGPKK